MKDDIESKVKEDRSINKMRSLSS